ncbi:hypothetical protein [Agromyces seonyuensis]|uniref:SnoaL-like domain-containing protein n=1 Tax=Agromyces seonyuensis TaxID=2662446 RepID=A0A6I4P5K4_9MICO|nr:hypothetical protein [Agromyces seonyuensis]MWB98724.1 hypothetical protein [Agromyces seonyuensis]
MPRDDIAGGLRDALDAGDELALAALLHPDVRMLVDSGDSDGVDARGRAAVARFLLARRARRRGDVLEPVQVNGCPGLAVRRGDGLVVGVLAADVGPDGRIEAVWLSTSAPKLAHWNRGRSGAD